MTDSQLRQDIIDELEFDPSFNGEHVGAVVDKNVVTLSGHVNSYAEKVAAIAAARRVKGVHAIAENIEVRYSYQNETADDQIAKRASDILTWDILVPPDAVDVLVHNGWVTLGGIVNWYYEKISAEDDVRKLAGVLGVTNNITIKPRLDSSDIRNKIESALKRHAEIEAKAIRLPCHAEPLNTWQQFGPAAYEGAHRDAAPDHIQGPSAEIWTASASSFPRFFSFAVD